MSEPPLTGRQRYDAAMRRAAMLREDNIRDFLAGRIEMIEAGDAIERVCLIEALALAYYDGLCEQTGNKGS